jgi:NAD(P)H dehydrogenase (quinone)
MSDKAKIAVIFYSTWGHIHKMANSVLKGAQSTGAEVTIFQIAETLPAEVLAKMHAAPKSQEIPVLQVEDLVKFDGLIFGAPTRYGSPAAQYKALWDATGQLWQAGALNGKVGSFFTGTATLGGGQETTAVFNMGHFVHHGMIFVPLGYGNPTIFNLDEVHGGSPWGAGTLSGADGSRQPTALELGLAEYQGKRVAEITIALKKGRAQ